ncbi:MAG: GGDEF domain-containing protein [Sulfurospirillum sp.]|nr:MAG: GGDEF domain-containing protein [Sulfurospirillum sp.]
MTVNELGKETIKELARKKEPLTPQNYSRTFCALANEKGFTLDDCEVLDKFVEKLNPYFQADLKNFNLNTQSEFITYLVANLNRLSSSNEGKLPLVLITLVKRLLQSITLLHDKEARELANASLERIEHLADTNTFSILKDKWFNFLTKYDDSFLENLRNYGSFKSDDIKDIVEEMIFLLNKKEDDNTLYQSLSSLIVPALTPSIASSMDDDLADISYEIKNSPHLLKDKEFQKRVKEFILKRIELDKNELKTNVEDIYNLLGNVSSKIVKLVENSSLKRDKIRDIKDELVALKFSKHNFNTIKEQLVTIANSLELEVSNISDDMEHDDETVKNLRLKIKKLEIALDKAKKETKIDFLTNLLSKRGLEEDLNRAEKSYSRYGIDYSIIFMDLDKFKMLNDTFGHEAGDLVLKSCGKIFNSLKRDVDVIGRYGGEEFLVLLPSTPLQGAKIFAEKIRQKIEKFEFLYKGERVPVTVSGGVVNRKDYDSQKEMIEAADALLYKAKEAGRNRIYSTDE